MDNPESMPVTYDMRLLEKSRTKWIRSAALRSVYGDLLREAAGKMVPGSSLEVGSGIGIAREFIPHLVTSDIVKTSYVDLECSAYDLPPAEDNSAGWANIFAFDVIHHLCRPFEFFQSALHVLRPGGRIVLVEPAASFWGSLFYRLFHPESIDPRRLQPPFIFEPDNHRGEFANMGMGISLFSRHRPYTDQRLCELGGSVLEVSFRDFLAYPLTGGYGNQQLLPATCIRAILKLENRLPRTIFRMAGLRMLIVIEKTTASAGLEPA